MATPTQDKKSSRPIFYRITIEGTIRENWSGWLNNMQISAAAHDDGSQTTTLIGKVADQAALRGLLGKIWDLNLTIISILRLEVNVGEKEGKK